MIPPMILLTLVDLTDMYTHALAIFRGDTLKNWESQVLKAEVAKLETRIPEFTVVWSAERRQFGLFVR